MSYKILYLKTGEYVYSVTRTDNRSSKLVPAVFNTYNECEDIINIPGLLVTVNPDTNNVYSPDTLVLMRSRIPPGQPYGWLFFDSIHLLEIVEVDYV